MVYTKAGFVICLVHRHLDCLFLLAPDEYPDGFRTPPLPSLISLAHPYLEGSPRELKPLFLVALSLSSQLGQEGPAHLQKLTQAHLQCFQHNSTHLIRIRKLRYVLLNYYARDGPWSPTG